MNEKIKNIILAYLKEKKGSNYVEPLRNQMPNYPFYNEQEQTYTDLTQLDSQHGTSTQDKWDKQFIYPEQEMENNIKTPDWGGGNFLAPYHNEILHEIYRTKNDADTLWDPLHTSPEVMGLNSRTSYAIDGFLSEGPKVKIANMDLTDFMKVSDDTLIHKSTKDLWKMFKDADGNIFISRLFDDNIIPEK